MRCKNCGQALSRGQTLCPNCGKSVEKQLRRSRNLRRFILIVVLIVLLTAGLVFLNLYSRNELPDLSFSSFRSLFIKDKAAEEPTPEPTEETPVPAEETPIPVEDIPAPAEETPEPVEEKPASAEETPVPVEVAPAPAEESPQPVEETPVPAEEKPEAVEESPVPAVTVVPTEAEAAPLSALERYRAVETKSFERFVHSFCAQYGNERRALLDSEGRQTQLLYRLGFGELAQKLLSERIGTDMSWLEELALSLDAGSAGELAGFLAELSLNGEFVTDAQIVFDLSAGQMTVYLPDISEQPFSVELPSGEGSQALTREQLAAVAAALPSEEELERLLLHYGELILRSIDTVELSEGVLEAEGVMQNCSVLSVSLDEQSAERLASAVIGELRWDETLRAAIEGTAEALGRSPGESYERFLDRLDELDYSLSSPAGDAGTLRMLLYADEADILHGRTVEFTGESGTLRLSCALPREGERFGLELRYADEEQMLELAGRGVCAEESVEGDFVLRSNAERLARLSFRRSGSADGALVTDITLTPSRSVYLSLFPASLREEAHDLSLVLHSEGEGERGELTAALLRAAEEALRLSVTAAPGAGVSLEAPEEAATREDWVSSLNVDNFASILDRLEQAGVPGRLLRQLHTSLSDALSAK